MPSGGQEGRWDGAYDGNAAFFGEVPSEFARTALGLFRGLAEGNVLELGCGQGRDTLLFAREGFHVTALDYSEAGLLELRRSAGALGVSDRIVARRFDVREPLPFPDGSFDACYSHMLLCMELSTEELRFLLGEIRRVLKAGGIALYTVRNDFDRHFGTGTRRSEAMYEIDGFVVRFFSEEKVRDLAAGYEIVELRRMREGSLPRELYGVVLRKRETSTDIQAVEGGEVRAEAERMPRFGELPQPGKEGSPGYSPARGTRST